MNCSKLVANVFIVVCLFFSLSSNARIYATVKKMKGDVTKLLPGALRASKVVPNEKLPEDTSIVTGPRSFVRLVFQDRSQVSLGPSSKLVVAELQKGKAGVLSLLKGRLRSKVQKETDKKDGKNKLFVKTRTAALGVRGTEFQAIYNPENRVTNLLTFEGKVAVAKVDESKKIISSQGTQKKDQYLERTRKGEVRLQEEPIKNHISQSEELEKALSSQDAVEVEKGQFSGVSDSLSKASMPVKISPVQFTALYGNSTLRGIDENYSNLVDPGAKGIKFEPQVEQKAPLEGGVNEKTGHYAPKSGGLIDLNSGVYISPKEDAPFDPSKRVYVSQGMGSIDSNSGDFVAPKGLKLDAVKGFIADKESDEKLLALSSQLNKDSNLPIWARKKDGEDLGLDRILSSRELFSKAHVKISLIGQSQKIEAENSPQTPGLFIESTEGRGIYLDIGHRSDGRWQLINEIGLRSIDFKSEGNYRFDQGSTSLVTIGIGVKRFVSNHWIFVSRLSLEQEFFFQESESLNRQYVLGKTALFKWRNYFEGNFYRWNKLEFNGHGGIVFAPKKDSGEFESKTQFGTFLGLGMTYWYSRLKNVGIKLYNESFSGETFSSGFSADQKHDIGGIRIFTSLYFD